jgi:GH25 family lysozyme M1 (1,4-beta-N-acetylmuramidase)
MGQSKMININRRGVVVGAASAAALVASRSRAQDAEEVDLVDDAPLGEMGNFDVKEFGPASTRAVREAFRFPADVDSATAYGIDISHHTKAVPWAHLADAKINYVYIKASQGARNRDATLEKYWAEAANANIPCGAYHFLSAGVPGKDQGAYFVKRLKDVGGLKPGRHLQPVIDLEWDFLGKDFKRQVISAPGKPVAYKDFWSDYTSAQIVKEMNDCIAVLRQGVAPLGIKPLIYTNRSWWEIRIKPDVRFEGCTIWTSDYRKASYTNGVPRSVSGHAYNLWQFTEKGGITVGGEQYGPFDCNKLVHGSLQDLLIS